MRIEVVTASVELPQLCERLRTAGIANYTVFRSVHGLGERGQQGGVDLTGVSENSYLLTTCTREQLPRIIEVIRQVLSEFGGECLVSEAMRIKH